MSDHVTPDTLTDEMIREFRDSGDFRPRKTDLPWCCLAVLGRDWLFTSSADLAYARGKICDAINARRSKP